MTGLEYLKYGPALHELAHQWANFALPTHSVSSTGTDLTSFLLVVIGDLQEEIQKDN